MPKFSKEQVLEELKSKIPTNGNKLNLSERSIKENIETLFPLFVTEETELNDFVEKVLPLFRTADANVRNDISQGIKEYKTNNPIQATEVEKQKTQVDENLQKALDRIAELEKKNLENEKKQTLEQRRSSIISKMADKGCKNTEWIKTFLEEVNLDDENFNADERADKYLKIYNKTEASRFNPSGVKVPEGGGTDNELTQTIKAASDFLKSQQL